MPAPGHRRSALIATVAAVAALSGVPLRPAAASASSVVGSIGGPAAAGLYGWGATTMPDGSVLIGDYWNLRIVHYAENGADLGVFAGHPGFGPGTNQAPYGLAVDPVNGDVYMAEASEPDVNVYTSTGAFKTSYGRVQAVHHVDFAYPSRVAISSNETIYVADTWANDIVVMNQAGTVLKTLGAGVLKQPRGISFDNTGNLWVADEGSLGVDVFNVQTGAVTMRFGGRGTTPGKFVGDLRGLVFDRANGVAYVVDGYGNRVNKFDSAGRFLLRWGSQGTGPGQFEDGGREVTVDGQGDVWVGDLGNFRAMKFSPSGALLLTVPNPPEPPPTGGFNGPRGVAVAANGDVYVTDTYNERIEEFDGSGHFIRSWGMRGEGPYQFNYPRLLAVDPNTGDVVIADTDSNAIVRYSSTGGFLWEMKGVADPYGVTVARNGTIYVADSNHHEVTVMDSGGHVINHFGAGMRFPRGIAVDPQDQSIWVSDGPTGVVSHFSASGAALGHLTSSGTPYGVAVDSGYVYVAESSSNVVQQWTRGGTLVGSFGGGGSALGKLHTPQGLAFDPAGHLLVCEQNNERISIWTVT